MSRARTRFVVAIESSKEWLYDSGHSKKMPADLRASHLRSLGKTVKVMPAAAWHTLSLVQNVLSSR